MTTVSTSAAIGPGLGGMVRDYTGAFTAVFAALAVIDLVLLLIVLQMRAPVMALGAVDGVLSVDFARRAVIAARGRRLLHRSLRGLVMEP